MLDTLLYYDMIIKQKLGGNNYGKITFKKNGC